MIRTSTIYKLIRETTTGEIISAWREWSDGVNESYSITAKEYLDWVAEGNTPLPPDDMPINIPEPSVLEQAVVLLLKLSTPTSPEDIALKDELTSKLQPK